MKRVLVWLLLITAVALGGACAAGQSERAVVAPGDDELPTVLVYASPL